MNPNNTTFNNNPGNLGTIETTFTFPEITNLIKKMFADTLPATPIDARPLFIDKSIPQGQGDSIQINEKDFTTYAADMPEGTNASRGQFGLGYHKQILWHRYGLEYAITYKLRTTAMWLDVVTDTVNALSKTVPQRINLDMTHHITFGNTVGYVDQDGYFRDLTVGDTNPLFFATHALAFSTKTYSNIVPGNPAFTKSALESAELLTKTDILDNFGKLRRMTFKTIFCADTPNLTNSIMQYIRSTTDPIQANPSVINPYLSKFDMMPLCLLTTDVNGIYDGSKANWWGIAALTGTGAERWQAYNVIWEPTHLKTMPTLGNNAEDPHNDDWIYGVRGACNQAALSGRGIIISMH